VRAWVATTVIATVILAVGGCNDSGGTGVTSEPPPVSGSGGALVGSDDSAQQSAAAAKGSNGSSGPAVTKAQFVPLLQAEYGKYRWPDAYTISTEKIWTILLPRTADTQLTEVDARSAVGIWATCAWTLQLIDSVKSGKSTEKDISTLNAIATVDLDVAQPVQQIAADARLGEIATAREFTTANECSKGFAS
jgi:hypothetical protein